MSVITTVVLCMRSAETSNGDDEPPTNLQEINAWLKALDYGPLEAVDDRFGGDKACHLAVFGAAYNHMSGLEDEFAAFVMSRSWVFPEHTVLILTPDSCDDDTRIFRPHTAGKEWKTF